MRSVKNILNTIILNRGIKSCSTKMQVRFIYHTSLFSEPERLLFLQENSVIHVNYFVLFLNNK